MSRHLALTLSLDSNLVISLSLNPYACVSLSFACARALRHTRHNLQMRTSGYHILNPSISSVVSSTQPRGSGGRTIQPWAHI